MRLYSRGQVVFYSFCSALVVFLVLTGLGLFSKDKINEQIHTDDNLQQPFILNVSPSSVYNNIATTSYTTLNVYVFNSVTHDV